MSRTAAGWKLKRRKGVPYWYVYFTLPGRGDFLLSTGVTDESGARAKAAEIVSRTAEEVQHRAPVQAAQRSLKQLADAWTEGLRKTRGDVYANRAETDLINYVEPRWEHPSQITAEAWNDAKDKLHSEGTLRKARLSWQSIANLSQTLRAFLRYCQKQGVIEVVPEIKAPSMAQRKADRAQRHPMDREQVEAFLLALLEMGEVRAHRIYTVLFETWQRKSTIEKLTRRWCNFNAEELTIPAGALKSRRQKVIDLTPRCAEAIKAEMAERGSGLDDPIFGAFNFHQTTDATHPQGGVFEKACLKAGIDLKGRTAHHGTRTTALSIAGQDPEASLSALMAQAAIESPAVVEHYLKPSLKAARRLTRRGT